MKIEIGKTYSVCPKWKKSFEEVEYFRNEDGRVVAVNVLWRSGSVLITPQNEEEVKWLEDALADEDGKDGAFEPYSFEDFEFSDTWDGVSEELQFIGKGWTEEEQDIITEAHEEGDEFISTILEENEFFSEDAEVFMHNGIMVELFEGYGQ
ncbi:hypothetical protein OAA34_00015 [bacterium]|nr:hypothetical protein [bacterium]